MHHQKQITIELPIWPPELWPNRRVHWRPKARATKKYRESAKLAAIFARNSHDESTLDLPWRSAIAAVVVYFATRRRRDPDNCAAALKAAWDGLVTGGLLVDDDLIAHWPIKIELDHDNPRVVITLTQQPAWVAFADKEKKLTRNEIHAADRNS